MKTRAVVMAACAALAVFLGTAGGPQAQQAPRGPMMQQDESGPPGSGPGRAAWRDQRGWAGGHMHGPALAMMMAMMDTDGDQALTLAEMQAVHGRLFAYADQDNDGKLTAAEIRTFMATGGFETRR